MFEDVALRWKDEFLQLWLCFFKVALNMYQLSQLKVQQVMGRPNTKMFWI